MNRPNWRSRILEDEIAAGQLMVLHVARTEDSSLGPDVHAGSPRPTSDGEELDPNVLVLCGKEYGEAYRLASCRSEAGEVEVKVRANPILCSQPQPGPYLPISLADFFCILLARG